MEKVNPQVIPNISQDNLQTDITSPTEDAIKIAAQINDSRQRLVQAMKNFNQILSKRVLPENRSSTEKEEEQSIISELTAAALEIDRFSRGEGTLALSIFALRQTIFLKDAGNRLAYEIEELKKKIPNSGLEEDKEAIAKQKVLDFAKTLGVNVSLEKKK